MAIKRFVMPRVKCWQVDAFTDRPFGGNPAAVCWLDEDAPENWMQAIAAEMNLAATAFVRRREDGYGLRWFTPQVEVPLCGHATLATARALWAAGIAKRGEILSFHTKSGLLTCTREGETIELDFPALPASASSPSEGLLEALGIKAPLFVGRTKLDCLVVLDSPERVRSLRPDFRKLAEVPTRGVILTARSDDPQYDFLSRFFAPAMGIDEDSVLAHGPRPGRQHSSLGIPQAKGLSVEKMTNSHAKIDWRRHIFDVRDRRVPVLDRRHNMNVIIIEGDLLDQRVDVIVNAWNRNIIPWWLLLPQGVSGVTKKQGGTDPFKELRKHGAIPLGEAVLTSAGNLPFKGIIHVAGINMLWRASEKSIRDSVRNALALAEKQRFESIAFPLIGAGSGGFNRERAKAIMLDKLQKLESPLRATVVVYKARRSISIE